MSKSTLKKLGLVLCLLIGYSVQSQVLIALLLGDKLNSGKVEFGLDGGLNFSTMYNMDSDNWARNFNLGFYFDIRMKEQWYLNTGVLVKSTLGISNLTENDLEFLEATTYPADGEYKQRLNYFLVPALAKYKFKNNMYAEFGPQFGLLYKAHIEFISEVDGNSAKIREKNLDMMNRFDVGLTAGAGYRLLKGMGWTLGARYYYGFLDVYKDRSGTNNSALFLKVNIPFGLSQEKKDQIKAFKEERSELKAQKKQDKKASKAKEKSSIE